MSDIPNAIDELRCNARFKGMKAGELLFNGRGRVKSDLDKGREGSFFSVRLLIRVKPVLQFAFTLHKKGEV